MSKISSAEQRASVPSRPWRHLRHALLATALLGGLAVAQAPPTDGEGWIELKKGLRALDLVEGTGKEVRRGHLVQVHYTGWLEDGTKFDSSLDSGRSFTFPVGEGRVIRGWDLGVVGMKVGGKRRLVIAPKLGYGKSGAGGRIPPDATLIFDIEVLSTNRQAGR